MDSLQTLNRLHRLVGSGGVVLRQCGVPVPWILCCDAVEGQADVAWAWQHIRCTGHVRALRGGEQLFAERADFNPGKQVLTLTGSPRLRRGDSLLRGDRIDVDLGGQALTIARPRGALAPPAAAGSDVAPGIAWAPGAALPDSCPLAWQP